MMNRILPLVLIVLAIGLLWLYTIPTYNTNVQAANQKIQGYNAALQAAQQFTEKENQLIAQRNAIPQSSLTRLETFLPDGVDSVQLILDINQLASRYGLALSDFTISTPATGPNAANPTGAAMPIQNAAGIGSGLTNSITLSVDATGPYQSFRSFITAAEQSLRPLDINQMSIVEASNGNYKYSITFKIYWLQ